MDNLVKRIETLEEFFGCEFIKVNKTIRLILIYGCKGETPEWLRGKNKYTAFEFPRPRNSGACQVDHRESKPWMAAKPTRR
jgi:hypothetical protein